MSEANERFSIFVSALDFRGGKRGGTSTRISKNIKFIKEIVYLYRGREREREKDLYKILYKKTKHLNSSSM